MEALELGYVDIIEDSAGPSLGFYGILRHSQISIDMLGGGGLSTIRIEAWAQVDRGASVFCLRGMYADPLATQYSGLSAANLKGLCTARFVVSKRVQGEKP